MQAKRTLKKQAANSRKQLAQSTKQIAATKRTLKRTTKSSTNLLKEYNRLLGEDYDSLAAAKRAFKRETVSVKKAIPKQIKRTALKSIKSAVSSATKKAIEVTRSVVHPTPVSQSKQSQPHIDVSRNQKVYTLRDLRDGDKRNVLAYLDDRLNANALDKALLKPGEAWAAQVQYRYTGTDGKIHTGYAKTYQIYDSSYALFRKLAGYVENAKLTPNQKANWLLQIKIMKFGGSETEWKATKQAEKNTQDVRRKKVSKQLAKKGTKVKVKTLTKIPNKKG